MLAITALDVAFAAAIAAVVTGIAAPLASWMTARHGTASARALAREERIYASRVEAYDEAMTVAYHMQAIAVQSVLAMDRGEPMPYPSHFDNAKNLEVAARMEVRGSEVAAQAFVAVSSAVVAYLQRWEELGGPFSQRPPDDIREQLYTLRDAVKDSRQALGNRVRADLGHV